MHRVPHLSDSIDEAVDLVLAHPAGIEGHRSIVGDLTEDRVRRAPVAFGKSLAHLLRGTEQLYVATDELARIAKRLHDLGATDEASTIIEEAVRLGFLNAADWLR